MIDQLRSISFSGTGLFRFVSFFFSFYRLRWKYYFEIIECLLIHGGMCIFIGV